MTQITNAEGHSSYKDYTDYGELHRITDEEGLITGYDYNEQGLLTQITLPNGAIEYLQYNDGGQCTAHTFADGTTAIAIYDKETAMLVKSIAPNGTLTEYEYYPNGLLQSLRKENVEQRMLLAYDKQHNLQTLTLPDGRITQWAYDALGRCITHQMAGGGAQTFNYDNLNRVIRTALPDNNVLELAYNAYDEVVQAKDNKHHVKFSYTPLGSLKTRQQEGRALHFNYNTEEELVNLSNEKDEHYNFLRNNNGQIIKETGFDGREYQYRRSPAGKVMRIDRPENRWTEYEYNNMGSVVLANYSDGSWDAYGYDKNNRLHHASNQNTTIDIKRNDLGSVIQETDKHNHAVNSTYDKYNRRIKISSSLGADITISRNLQNGQVETMEANGWQAHLQYNNMGLEVERLMTGNVSSNWAYDRTGRPTAHKVQTRNCSETQRHKTYEWSTNDKLQSITDQLSNQTRYFYYDAFDNLEQVAEGVLNVEAYFRDEVGNIFNTTNRNDKEYTAGGQLKSNKEGWQYIYDNEGFLTQKSKGREVWSYAWYGNGMLRKVTRPDLKTIIFAYDALGLRTLKIFDGKSTRWLWNGNIPLHEWMYEFEDRALLKADEWGFSPIEAYDNRSENVWS